MFGLFTGAIATIAFGFSRTLPALILCRVIAGGLNGNMAVLKGMIAEISDDSNQARAYSLTPALFACEFMLISAQRAVHNALRSCFHYRTAYHWQSRQPLRKISRYFRRLCVVGGLSLPLAVHRDSYLPYHRHCYNRVILEGDFGSLPHYQCLTKSSSSEYDQGVKATVATSCSKTDETVNCHSIHSSNSRTMLTHDAKPRPSESSLASLLTPRVRVAVLNYSTVALISNMLSFIQPLFMATTPKYGGLGLSPSQIGSFLSALGIYNGVVQAIFFPIAHRILGTTSLFQISLASNIVLFAFWPIISHLAKQTEEVSRTLIGLQIAQLALLPLERMAFSTYFDSFRRFCF